MDVSKNRGTLKWMVKIMVPNPIKMDDLGVPLFLETGPDCQTRQNSVQFLQVTGLEHASQRRY